MIYGKVLMCTGVTLGQHYWGGCKEGVGAAFQKCRNCQCTFEQMQTNFREEAFNPRTKETYNFQCDAIKQAPTPFRKICKQLMGLHKEVFFASYLHLM